jgi:hypothetical protein
VPDMTPESVPVARRDVAGVEVDGEMVLYDDSQRRLHRLNPTAALVWQCLDGSASLREIAGDVAEVFSSDPRTVLRDIVALAGHFAEEGLLEGTGPSAAEEDAVAGGVGQEAGANGEAVSGGDVQAVNEVPGPPFIAERPTPCMDRTFSLGASGSMAVRVGPHLLGLRASSAEVAEAARAVLAPALVEGVEAPPNVSVAETTVRAGRPQYWCYRSGLLTGKARGLQGAMRAAVRLLSSYADEGSREGSDVIVPAMVAVRGGSAVLICPQSRFMVPGLDARLRAAGWSLSGEPWARIDPRTGEVVIPPLEIDIDELALAALPADRLDGDDAPAGRYPVEAWIAPPSGRVDTSTTAGRLVGVAAESPDLARDPGLVLQAVSGLLRRADWRAAPRFDAPAFSALVNA